MATLLLVIIYIAFIGLGIPDSLFGPAWPVMHTEFGLDASFAGLLTPICTAASLLSSLFSARLTARLGTAKVTALSTALTAVGLLAYSLAPSVWVVALFSIPLGLGGGAIDAALNHYVALHYDAAKMSYLHCFYGVGVSLSPYLMSYALDRLDSWRQGYRLAFFLQLGITVLLFVTLPLWRRAHPEPARTGEVTDEAKPRTLTARQLWRLPGLKRTCLMFTCSCALEYLCSAWASTYLVDARGVTPAAAARAVLFYFLGLALGRFLSGLLSDRLSPWRIILLGQLILAAAVVLLLLPLPTVVATAALFLIGLGNGPTYPNLVYLTPSRFGEQASASVMGVQMASAYVGFLALPFLYGALLRWTSPGVFGISVAVIYAMLAAAIASSVLSKKQIRKRR